MLVRLIPSTGAKNTPNTGGSHFCFQLKGSRFWLKRGDQRRALATSAAVLIIPVCYWWAQIVSLGRFGMATRRGNGRRKVGRKKRRMRAKIRHRK